VTTDTAVATKRCARCAAVKPLSQFYRDNRKPDGRRSDCGECSRAYQADPNRASIAATGRWRRFAYTYQHVCGNCGHDFSSADYNARFCSLTCANKARRWTLECRVCGQPWEALAPTAFWCSDACRIVYEAAKRAPHAQVALWEPPAGWVHPKYATVPLRPLRKRWYAGQCACCGEWFVHDQPTTMTCSPRCRRKLTKAKYRASKKAAFVAPVSPRKIFERDKWICQLCWKPVKRDAVAPHPLAPVPDHIVPLEPIKGEPRGTHEPANVQCAHFLCNSRKGNRGGGEQLLLIG
jgi:5-methylcytosine-specific restriction endonuclease McrA